MFRLVIVLTSVTFALASNNNVTNDVTNEEALDNKIVGGLPAAPGQFPYQISMRMASTGQHHCGGTIITSRFIVTAAHCIYQHFVSDFYIVADSNSLSSGGKIYSLSNAVYNRKYDPTNIHNDIALLKTSTDIIFSALVQPLQLQTGEVPPGAILTLSGWGLASWPGSAPPNYLQYSNLKSIDINKCAQTLAPSAIYDTQICTFTRPGQGACSGDSGGPLVYRGTLAGVVSWGRPCAAGYPDVFTKVSAFVSWIESTMKIM